MNRKTLAAGVLAGLFVTLAACGGDESRPEASQQSDTTGSVHEASPEKTTSRAANLAACDLVTLASVGRIMGEEMQAGVPGGQQAPSGVEIDQCTWLGATPKSQAIASVFVRTSTGDEAKRTFERTRRQFSDALAVDGLGDGAYYVPSNGQLNILRGDAWVIVTASHEGLSNPGTFTQEHRALAQAALKAL